MAIVLRVVPVFRTMHDIVHSIVCVLNNPSMLMIEELIILSIPFLFYRRLLLIFVQSNLVRERIVPKTVSE